MVRKRWQKCSLFRRKQSTFLKMLAALFQLTGKPTSKQRMTGRKVSGHYWLPWTTHPVRQEGFFLDFNLPPFYCMRLQLKGPTLVRSTSLNFNWKPDLLTEAGFPYSQLSWNHVKPVQFFVHDDLLGS